MKIEQVPIGEIKAAKYNPRKHDPALIESLKRSIVAFGVVEPLVINADGTLIGGHQRLKAVISLGHTTAPCYRVNLSDTDAKILNIALNKISGDWDLPKLAELLIELDTGAVDMDLTGFREDEIEAIMNDFNKGEDERPEVEFTKELMESHNYVVLYFDNDVDWLNAQAVLGLKSVKALDSKDKYTKIGIGRVLRGAEAIERIRNA